MLLNQVHHIHRFDADAKNAMGAPHRHVVCLFAERTFA
jgi:hypothetical protein